VAYSEEGSLLLGDMRVSANVNKAAYVEDAANEIDSRIGVLYETPILLDDLENHSKALLKRLNNHLATGRLIMAEGIGAEDRSLHAYGHYMVQEALREIEMIAGGMIELEGAALRPAGHGGDDQTGPAIRNADAHSAVDAFYGDVMKAPGTSLNPPVWQPGS
jgi:hypothetical protein